MAYSAALLDHLERPRNAGELGGPAVVAEVTNSACGDRIRLWLRVDGGRIAAAGWQAYGCAPTLAAASALTELVTGRSVEQALALEARAIEAALGGLPRGKKHAAELCIEALNATLGLL